MHYLKLIETWKVKLNIGHKISVIFMDLSKVFDSLNHKLLIAKLKCYGLDQYAVDFSRKYQCCKYSWGLEKKFSPCTTGIYTRSFVVQHIFK